MSRVQKLRLFVSQRLNAAVEEILSAFEKTIVKYEEEAALSQEVIARQHALLCTLNKPLLEVPSADAFTQQLIGSKGGARLVQQQQQNQEDPRPSHVQEQVEVELQDLDEAEIIKFTYNRRCVMRPPEGVDLLAAGAAREETGSADSDQDVLHVLSSETEDSEDYSKDDTDPRPASTRLRPKMRRGPRGHLSCRVCSQTFRVRRLLFRHVRSHLLEAEQVCGLCGERFETTDGLRLHIQTHWATRGKNPENQAKTQNKERQLHQRSNHDTNTNKDQKPNRCDACGKKRKHRCCPQSKNQNPEGPEETKRKRKRRKT